MTPAEAHVRKTIEAVWRIESARLIAGLARMVRDIGVAEELAQDALVAAMEQWPASGVPQNPGAWLMATAKHRAIDHLRRNKRLERKHEELARSLEPLQYQAALDIEAAAEDELGGFKPQHRGTGSQSGSSPEPGPASPVLPDLALPAKARDQFGSDSSPEPGPASPVLRDLAVPAKARDRFGSDSSPEPGPALAVLRDLAVPAKARDRFGSDSSPEPGPALAVLRDLDDLLPLMFTACHPALSREARVALTLRLLGGLTTEEIARAFLVPQSTIAQRIVRAKRTLAEKRIPFEVPRGAELAGRLESVLETLYLVFNEGYSATAGEDWMRPALCEDALRLGRILAELVQAPPAETRARFESNSAGPGPDSAVLRAPEVAAVHGLVALMEIQASRIPARIGPSGQPILLLDQNRALWDHLLIRRGLAALKRAEAFAEQTGGRGTYLLQASIAACHARARTAAETDWPRIAELYGELAQLTPSPIVELNRAVAVSMADGPQAGLAILDAVAPSLPHYHLLPSVRGDLLSKLGRLEEARAEFERALALTQNAREQELLRKRIAAAQAP